MEELFPMRDAKRFEIRCPVTVQVSNGQKHQVKVQGELYDIGVDGARVALEQPVPPGTKITLYAHFRNPEEQVTTIRFEGVVQRLQEQPRFQIAVNFQGTGRYVQMQIVDLHASKAAGADEES
jgi:PilZ domain